MLFFFFFFLTSIHFALQNYSICYHRNSNLAPSYLYLNPHMNATVINKGSGGGSLSQPTFQSSIIMMKAFFVCFLFLSVMFLPSFVSARELAVQNGSQFNFFFRFVYKYRNMSMHVCKVT